MRKGLGANWAGPRKISMHKVKVTKTGRSFTNFLGEANVDLLLMEEIRLTTKKCMKPCKQWDKLPTSTGAGILPSTVLQGFGIRPVPFRAHKAAASERKLQDEIGAFVDLTESLPIEVHPI